MPEVGVHKRTIIPQLLGVGSKKLEDGRLQLHLVTVAGESFEFELGHDEKMAIVKELVGVEIASADALKEE